MENPLTSPEKTVASYTLFTYILMLVLAVSGGLANYFAKVKAKEVSRFNLTELIGDLFISGFVGIIMFWLCEAADFQPLITAAMVGISGHMGGRLVGKFEIFAGRKLGLDDPEQKGKPGVF